MRRGKKLPKGDRYERVFASLPRSLVERLDHVAEDTGRARSLVLRTALEEFLKRRWRTVKQIEKPFIEIKAKPGVFWLREFQQEYSSTGGIERVGPEPVTEALRLNLARFELIRYSEDRESVREYTGKIEGHAMFSAPRGTRRIIFEDPSREEFQLIFHPEAHGEFERVRRIIDGLTAG